MRPRLVNPCKTLPAVPAPVSDGRCYCCHQSSESLQTSLSSFYGKETSVEYLPGRRNCSLCGAYLWGRTGGKERLCRLASPHCWAGSSPLDSGQGCPHLTVSFFTFLLPWVAKQVASGTYCRQSWSAPGRLCPHIRAVSHACSPFTSPTTINVIAKWEILIEFLQHVRCYSGDETKGSGREGRSLRTPQSLLALVETMVPTVIVTHLYPLCTRRRAQIQGREQGLNSTLESLTITQQWGVAPSVSDSGS